MLADTQSVQADALPKASIQQGAGDSYYAQYGYNDQFGYGGYYPQEDYYGSDNSYGETVQAALIGPRLLVVPSWCQGQAWWIMCVQ